MIKEWISEWFVNNGVSLSDVENNMGSNYLEVGFLDSLGFLGLISDCEDHFSMVFSDDDFSNDLMFTINGLSEIISNKVS